MRKQNGWSDCERKKVQNVYMRNEKAKWGENGTQMMNRVRNG